MTERKREWIRYWPVFTGIIGFIIAATIFIGSLFWDIKSDILIIKKDIQEVNTKLSQFEESQKKNSDRIDKCEEWEMN